jgi:3-oxoacyl-[acyl-carrier-protein] synthase-3
MQERQIGRGVAFTGCGAAKPAATIDNEVMSRLVDTSDEWIATRTGIRHRHIAGFVPGKNGEKVAESLVSLSVDASKEALAMAQVAAIDLDLIILATSTSDDLFGSATKIQGELGASRAVAFDLTAACSGFVFALVTAAQFIRSGTYKKILVVGADVLSRWVDWQDRTTCVLFGDGAGAMVLEATDLDRLLGYELCSDGTLNDCLNLPFQGETRTLIDDITVTQGNYRPISMNGKEVYRFAVNRVPEAIDKALYRAELLVEDIDWLVLHQANQRILDAVAERMNIPADRVVSNVSESGNTSAASIPMAWHQALKTGKVKSGDTIATCGFGAGLSWGAAIFKWGK